jgi:uncharacterized lipoprotein YmbA
MKKIFIVTIFFALLSLTACSTNKSEGNINGIRFYALHSLPPSTTANNKLRIGVGPLEIPRLINRPQIVSRKNQSEINMTETHQWGGSHKEELIQVITDNLSSLLKTESIQQYPWKFSFKPHYQVRINIERFDGELGKNVQLIARWWLLKNNKEILVKRAVINSKTHGNSYSDYVNAQSQALKVFSQQIMRHIK